MRKIIKTRLQKAIFLTLLVLLIGVVGYVLLFDYSFVDALYMAIITFTTVGFGEVQPFGVGEKVFTIVLILLSLVTFGYTVSTLSEYFITGQFFRHLKQKKVQKLMDDLQGHTIVCGYGRNGKQALAKLQEYNKPVVVIEGNKDIIQLLDDNNILNIEGDATLDETLIRAGILKANSLIAALPSDADNLFIVLSASQLNKDCKIISRASNESSYDKLKFAGAENVIMPDKLGGDHMASLVVTPDVIEFVDSLSVAGDTTTNLKEISVNDLPEKYLNKTILDLDLRNKTGCTVIGFKDKMQEYIINPDVTTVLEKDTFLILLGREEQIQKLQAVF